ncbi:ABC transporter permease subunit [Nonomuraea phyllanthi]|uniref:ABC transporter permease subunit n=1 Tax=Nonomuraea phyllanthi TaxID=2219224 RepID=A0A5C4W8C6_9ACTN|nr:carbohydrate ABC transporter permease [Nonomuraea phyllanthi]KAB8192314.1 ABC transporter permease subunit [Nonomuraea phyllanthi]QFY11331.1 ABC transporter permease subunit [Nonomuraea phyllanthi]
MTITASRPATELSTAQAARRRRWRTKGPLAALLALLSLLTVSPFAAMFIVALSPEGEPTVPRQWPDSLTLDNITRVLSSSGFATWTVNSLVYALVSVVIILLTSSMAGYAFAKKRFPGREAMFWTFLATMMVPFQATLIPTFVLVNSLSGVDTFWGLIVPTLANSQAVFLMRQFILGLPDELFDAAKVDGASEWRVYWTIVVPLTKPILATLGVFVFLWHWNDFLWPLVVGQSDATRTLTVGLTTLRTEELQLSVLMASAAVSVLPCLLVFFLLQRYLVNSIAMTGLK